jgi:hypothetical protein
MVTPHQHQQSRASTGVDRVCWQACRQPASGRSTAPGRWRSVSLAKENTHGWLSSPLVMRRECIVNARTATAAAVAASGHAAVASTERRYT